LQDGNRLQCQEPGQVMQWALKPVTDNTMFELFAGEESSKATQYTPGKLIKISLRTKKYDSQYNGLLLYAIDAADTSADPAKLGKWEFQDTEDRFHSFCPGTVLHGSAALKPYLTSWRFLPPDNFRGTIKFIGLIKVGPANDGSFYYPNELTLTATGAAPLAAERWYRGANNKSCDDTCRAVDANLRCDSARLASVNTAAKFEATVAPFVTCRQPLLVRCTDQGLSGDAAGNCYYANTAECTAAGLTTTATTCDAVATGANGRRICPCMCAPGSTCSGPTSAPTTSKAGTTLRSTTTVKPTVRPTTKPAGTPGTPGTPGTQGSNPQPTEPQPTEPPKPVCTAQLGCQCGPNGECPAEAACTLQGNVGFCLTKAATCNFGQLGCACKADNTCDDALECSMGVKVCARKADDQCVEGLLGCQCLSECMRPDAQCKKAAESDSTGVCALAVEQKNVCEAGTLGCPCAADKACNEEGFECKAIGRQELCVDMRIFIQDKETLVSSASTWFASCLAVLVAVAAAF